MTGKGSSSSQVPAAIAAVLIPGVAAFILGVLAENVKPTETNPTEQFGLPICLYPDDSSPRLGILALALLFLSFLFAVASLVFPYNGRAVPVHALFRSTGLVVFVLLSLIIFLTAEGLLLWAAISQSDRGHHVGAIADCPSAKPGLFGGAAFLALDATLFWLVCLMLALNAREDYLEDTQSAYGELDVRYSTSAAHPPSTPSFV